MWSAPAIQVQHAPQRHAEGLHLHVVASTDASSLRSGRLPPAHAFEHRGHVPVVREVVECTLGRAFDGHLRRELASRHPKQDMTVLRFTDGQVSVDVSVARGTAVSGSRLRDSYLADIRRLTLGLVQARGDSLYVGPVVLLRFGRPKVTRSAVEWPIEGGIAARHAAGRFRIESLHGRLVASVEGYRPLLPVRGDAAAGPPTDHTPVPAARARPRTCAGHLGRATRSNARRSG